MLALLLLAMAALLPILAFPPHATVVLLNVAFLHPCLVASGSPQAREVCADPEPPVATELALALLLLAMAALLPILAFPPHATVVLLCVAFLHPCLVASGSPQAREVCAHPEPPVATEPALALLLLA